MSQQALDLRRSSQIVRRHKVLVAVVAFLGILGGCGYAVLNPPKLTSTALVVLPQSAPSMATQVVIAESDPVLTKALPRISPALSLQQLRGDIHVNSLTNYVISFAAKGKTAAAAETIADAVAGSYIDYVGSVNGPIGYVPVRLLESAGSATGTKPVGAATGGSESAMSWPTRLASPFSPPSLSIIQPTPPRGPGCLSPTGRGSWMPGGCVKRFSSWG
jgi:capsular polysaccharide biosynthesis protein